MVHIKELKKIENPIKEIEKKKIESIEDEFEDEEESVEDSSLSFLTTRRTNKTSTLDMTESTQTTEDVRQTRVSKEDEKEMNFRPSYTGGGNTYQSNNYTPVGSAESKASKGTRELGDRQFDNNRVFENNNSEQQQNRGEVRTERSYAGERDQEEKNRRRNLM